ncbi:MAG: hypothetical protein WCO53_08650, partial [Deltaproteobacteria bacterium]
MAINDISLTSGMRTNLVSLQTTTELLNRTQDRLSSGKKVNTALDNALNFFTAKALNTRADELAGYKDGMSEAVQTIKAANAGISAIEGLIGQAKAVAATAKAGGTSGTGAVSNITVDLAGITNGQTIYVGGKTFTAVATDGHIQKTIDFTGITAGNTVTIGNTTYQAVGKYDSITFGAAFAVADTITVGATQYLAKGQYDKINFANIAVDTTVTVGNTQYTAVGKYESITFASTSPGQVITIGSTTYVGTAGAVDGQEILGIVYFNVAGTIGEVADIFKTKLNLNGGTSTASLGVITLGAVESAGATIGLSAGITTQNHTLATTQFIITIGADATNATTFAALLTSNGGTAVATSGVITLSGNTTAQTVSTTGGSGVTIGTHVNAANEFTITYAATAANATAFQAKLAETSETSAISSAGVIALSGNTTAGTVAGSTITIGSHVLATTQFIITIGADAANAATFFALAGGTTSLGTYDAGASNIKLSIATSAATSTESGGATISESTVSLAATEFYIGVGSTTTTATDNMTAANLAAKINGFGELAASVSIARINLLSGTLTLTDGGAASTVTTDDNVTSTATSATNGFTIVINKSTTDRTTYAAQFNTIMAQLDLLATDSSYKGINFLETGSSLDVMFGTSSSDKITLTGFDASATGLLSKTGSFLKTAENTWSTNAYVDV